jgi:NAD(P)-dependent dehydrogenase (short-subunit alcohol dehydrogenase family)
MPAGARPSKVVLITGCSTGIGRATAEHLAREGWKVFATARRVESIEDLRDAGIAVMPLDVTDEASMESAVRAIEVAEGPVGVLVNNAGYGLQGPAETTSMEEIRRQFETNVFGLIRLTQLVLPGMRDQRWGRIVNVSSMGGRMTLPGGAYYHASKYSVEAFSDALRFEVRPFGVTVSLIEPGPVLTKFGDTAVGTIDVDHGPYRPFEELLAHKVESAYEGPTARLASSPEQVAKVIERAISARRPKARYVVGPVARSLVNAKRFLPDRGFDMVLRSQFKWRGSPS